jgi:hypothetical protein
LREAYRLRSDPVLLYNLGRAYEGLGDRSSANEAYDEYFRQESRVAERPAIERRVALLRKEIAERQELRREREEALERESALRRTARSTSALPWVLSGMGGAIAIAGGVFGVVALDRHDDAVEGPQAEIEQSQDEAKRFATVANVGFVLGGLLLAAGITWAIFDTRPASPHP